MNILIYRNIIIISVNDFSKCPELTYGSGRVWTEKKKSEFSRFSSYINGMLWVDKGWELMKLGFPSCISILFLQREQMGVRTIKRRKRLYNTGISAI